MMIKPTEELKKYAVKIFAEGSFTGSGVLWKPEGERKNKLYIFTAAHVIKDRKNIAVQFMHDDQLEKIEVQEREIIISEKYNQEGDPEDLGIMEIEYDYPEFVTYRIANWDNNLKKAILENKELIMYGYPQQGGYGDSFLLSRSGLMSTYEEVDSEIHMMKYSLCGANINTSERDEELFGFSGTGIFAEIDEEFILVGIHKGSAGTSAERGELLGTTTDFLREMCMSHQIDGLDKINEINGNLSDRETYFKEEVINELEEPGDIVFVSKVLGEILKHDMSEVIESTFCNFCKDCSFEESYHKCSYFRGFLLVLSVFLKSIDKEINLKSPKLRNESEIPIYFICSEGKGVTDQKSQTRRKWSHFIHALKSNKELSFRLKENCIVIWGCEHGIRDRNKVCSKKDYEKYLFDITRRTENQIDITSVFSEASPKVIIHIDEITDMLIEGNIEKLYEKFTKYIEEIEK